MSCTVIIIGYGNRRPTPLEPADLPPQVHILSACAECVGGGQPLYDVATAQWTFLSNTGTPTVPTTEIYVLLFVEMGGVSGLERAQQWMKVKEFDWLKDTTNKHVHTIDHTRT